MLLAVVQSQGRLAFRSAGPWITLATAVALAAGISWGGATGRIFYHYNELGAPIFCLLAMLFTATAARREHSEHVEELIGALPYEAAPWVLGRFLVQYLIWLAVSVVAWAAAGAAVVLSGHPLDLHALALNWVVVVPAALAYATALALLIGSLARSAVTAYFLTLLAWLGGPLFRLLASRSTVFLPAPIFEFFAGVRVAPQGATGFFYNVDLVFFNRLVTLGIAVAALAVLLLAVARRRRRVALPYALLLGLALLLVAGAAREIQLDWGLRYKTVAAEMRRVDAAEPWYEELSGGAVMSIPTYPVVTDDYDLTVVLSPAHRSLAARANFAVTNVSGEPLKEIPLTLRQNFTVTGVTVDGEPVTARRQGDHLFLPVPLAPGETKQVSAAWEETVWQWRLQDGPRAAAHIDEESVLLPAHYGWYPLPGIQRLTRAVGQCSEFLPEYCPLTPRDLPVGHPQARFRIRVSGTDLHIRHSGDGETAVTTGLYLVGTPWPEEELHGLLVSVSPDNRVQAERAAAEIAGLMAEYEAMIPRQALGPVRLIQVHDDLYHGTPWLPTAGSGATPGSLLIHGQELARYWPGYFADTYGISVLALWWPQYGFTVEQGRLYRDFQRYMEYVRTGEQPRYPDTVFERLLRVEQTAGREAALQVLREMHALLPAGPAPEDFEAAIGRIMATADHGGGTTR